MKKKSELNNLTNNFKDFDKNKLFKSKLKSREKKINDFEITNYCYNCPGY